MHEVLVNRLGGPSLPRKSVVRLTDRPDMTLDVYRGRKTTIQYNTIHRECSKMVYQALYRTKESYTTVTIDFIVQNPFLNSAFDSLLIIDYKTINADLKQVFSQCSPFSY